MSDYAGESDVRIKFVAGMYSYQWPGDGEHWHIGALTFSGTGMDKVIFTETVQVTGTGAGGDFSVVKQSLNHGTMNSSYQENTK